MVLRRHMRNVGRKGGKLQPQWIGPCRITNIGPKYQVTLANKAGAVLKTKVAYDQLKPYHTPHLPITQTTPHSLPTTQTTPHTLLTTQTTYLV
ncbi:hypothetical protein LSAT2_010117 [Lamellibrachia satsuma]|nr:hypothetical protein LSAT2_010117 [Lamellibrachia satsuma]